MSELLLDEHKRPRNERVGHVRRDQDSKMVRRARANLTGRPCKRFEFSNDPVDFFIEPPTLLGCVKTLADPVEEPKADRFLQRRQ
jgi:hypothetical protein